MMSHRFNHPAWLLACALLITSLSAESQVQAEHIPPLHQQIDELLERTRFGPVADVADDATFLRRVSLDLVGRIPTADEVRRFLADESPDKRVETVDRLLESRDFARHLAIVFDLILMERRGGKYVKTEEFRQYLEESFAADKSYLTIVREILAADGSEEKNRAAAAFYLERELAPDLLTRDIGRIFFGIDVQCAQCHNHVNIEDYYQEDYYGLQAFVVRASLYRPNKKQPALIAEKAEGEAAFQSVFTDRSSMTGPRLPGGVELVDVMYQPGERYVVSPAKGVRHLPKFSRLQSLADTVFEHPTEQFNRNLANRLWGHMFGRGLVHPPDLHHSGNPPVHPELLALLADAVESADYDIKTILREIALSRVYQFTDQPKPAPIAREQLTSDIAALETRIAKEKQQARDAARAVDSAVETLDAAALELKPLRKAIAAAEKQVIESIKKHDAATKKLKTSQTALTDLKSKIQEVQQALEKTKEKTKKDTKTEEEEPQPDSTDGGPSMKLKNLQEQLPKLQEKVATATKQLQETQQKLASAKKTTDQAITAAQPQENQVRILRDKLISIRRQAAEHRSRVAFSHRKQKHLATLLESLKLKEQLSKLNHALPLLVAEMKATKARLPKLNAEQSAAEQKQKAAEDAVSQAQRKLKRQTAQHAELQMTYGLLKASLEKLDEATKRLPEKAALSEARSQIDVAVEAARNRMTASAAQLAEQQALLKTKQDLLKTARASTQATMTAKKQQQAKKQQVSAKLRELRKLLAETQDQTVDVQAQVQQHAAERVNAISLTPLSPEQLGLSMLVATGQLSRIRAGELARLNKKTPLSKEDRQNPEKVAARQIAVDAATNQSAIKSIRPFVQLFGAGSGQPQGEFFATADQALFLANGGELWNWLSPGGGNLTDRLLKLDSPEAVAEELYVSVFSRLPSKAEIAFVKNSLEQHQDDKKGTVQELAWGLLTSAEFRFRY